MSAPRDDLLIEKLKSLPPEQRAEVEDFIIRRERTRDGAARRLGRPSPGSMRLTFLR
jgi:hypothetical protein